MLPETQDRDATRTVFFRAWRRHREGEALEGVERLIVQVALRHPEYQTLLADPERFRDADYTPEMGRTNPFLHMGMHVAIEEQISVDAPRGMRELYVRIKRRVTDDHEAQHLIMECLGRMLWQAARANAAPDERSYLDCLRRLADATPSR
jgi:Domain of unknown function (DUF1841)